jgi:hypothetical protein
MRTFQDSMMELKKQLDKGKIQEAYQGITEYFRSLRKYFETNYPNYSVPGNIYYGYFDMTYFAIIPESLKPRKLKIAVVFDYDRFDFEVWLSGANRDVQEEYWNLIKETKRSKYAITSNPRRDDYILSYTLAENPDFSNLEQLTVLIEKGTHKFIKDVERILADI